MKLHVGNGTVYLRDWCNVDLQLPGINLSSGRPDLVEKFATSAEAYYARHEDKTIESLRAGAATGELETVCDAYGSFDRLPCGLGEAEEVMSFQVFEHLSVREARAALDEVDRVLRPGGRLRLTVPDHEETLKRWRVTGDEFWKRHVLGSRRNEAAYHVMGWTRDSLRAIVEEFGLVCTGDFPNPHFYPSICMSFEKPGGFRPAWEYALQGTEIGPLWRVLEIGPGTRPWPRANGYLDCARAHLDGCPKDGPDGHKTMLWHFDLDEIGDNGHLPIDDKRFDFVFAAHVLEHVKRPDRVAAELGRIAHRGCIVMPSALKEGLFACEEGDHRWWVMPAPGDRKDPPVFFALGYARRAIVADSNASAALARVLRSGPNRLDADARVLRRWFRAAEPGLDVIHFWEGSCEVQVIS